MTAEVALTPSSLADAATAGPDVLGAGDGVAREACRRVLAHYHAHVLRTGQPWSELLHESLYREQQRLADAQPTPADAADRTFLAQLRHELARADAGGQRALLQRVLERYGCEVEGKFDPRVYRFATRVLPLALAALLHGGRPSRELFSIEDRVLLEGDVDGLRAAARRGTVVLVPTHVSNLDSLILGYAIYRLGLPPFAYGAGLNLFSNPLTSFFMHHLGAFTVDRTKSDPLYRELVKEYATVLLERGQHMLFFPGGTRSRSGGLEQQLKLGFLSKVVAAFAARKALDRQAPPLWLVPCTLTYPLVLEAGSLVEEYLRREGGPKFVDVRDESDQAWRWLGFLRGLSELDVRVHVRFGRPRDPFGNEVDLDGTSRDRRGRALDPARYLLVDDAIVQDPQRDAEYTRAAATAILESYRRDTVALPSSLLAFSLFACLRRSYPELDLFRFLRAVSPEVKVDAAELRVQAGTTLAALQALAARGQIVLDPALREGELDALLEDGRRTLATYHRDPAVLARTDDGWTVARPELLLYYRNRLAGFSLPETAAGAPARDRRAS